MDDAFDIAQQRNDYERSLCPTPTPEERLQALLRKAARLRQNIASEDWQYGRAERVEPRRQADREALRLVENEIRGLTIPVLRGE